MQHDVASLGWSHNVGEMMWEPCTSGLAGGCVVEARGGREGGSVVGGIR